MRATADAAKISAKNAKMLHLQTRLCSNPAMWFRSASPLVAIRLAIVCAFCMLAAQQAAYAHYIGHIGGGAQAASVPANDSGDAPLHSCTTCSLFAGLAAAPPAFVSPIAVTNAAAIPLANIPTAHIPARPALSYTARAPPAVL